MHKHRNEKQELEKASKDTYHPLIASTSIPYPTSTRFTMFGEHFKLGVKIEDEYSTDFVFKFFIFVRSR
jgi:hypothetical protein